MNWQTEDYKAPQWKTASRVHDWKNYVSDPVKEIWSTFSDVQKELLAEGFQYTADMEDWE
jgi:hypothetical protein